MIKNKLSIKSVIAKVLADNDMQEDTLRISDIISWCAEALARIGAFLELEVKVAGKGGEPAIRLENYQAALPTGLHSIIQAAISDTEDGIFYPMRESSGSFDYVRGQTIIIDDSDPNNIIYGTKADDISNTSFTRDLVYTIKPGYMNVNKEEGYIMLSYRTIPLDEDGYPYMPDDPGFEDALYWYLTMKLLYPKWVTGSVRDAVYYNARASWNFYSKQAYGNSMMPTGDMLESIKNTWNRLVPEMGEHDGFYSTVGQRQEIYNQTNPIYNGNGYSSI